MLLTRLLKISLNSNSALDVACREGWLTRVLIKRGIRTTGLDTIEGLVVNA